MFFSRSQKDLALNKGYMLVREYELSERDLIKVARLGNEKELKRAMEHHREIEYALLYTYTPEYRECLKKSFMK